MGKISSARIYIILVVIGIVFFPPFAKYAALKYKENKLKQRIVELKADNKRMETEKKKLETDLVYVEKKAREKMGVARKGEVVIKEAPKK